MSIHDELVQLCRQLGDPSRDLAILGEGNASARVHDDTFVVTTSGSQLAGVTLDDLVDVDLARAAALARRSTQGFDRQSLNDLAHPMGNGDRRIPSIETLLHSLILERTGCAFVGHTHPTSVLGLLCSVRGVASLASPLFPDEVVVCGRNPLVVPYAGPGPDLASVLDRSLADYFDTMQMWPKTIYLANHGLLALGETPAEIVAISTMAEKAARVRLHSLSIGEVVCLTDDEARVLGGRADEEYRRRKLVDGQ